MKKKSVLFIIWSFTYGGGAEKILANIVNHLDYSKYDIEVLEYIHSDLGKENVNENVKILNPIIDTTKKKLFSKIKNVVIDKVLMNCCPEIVRRVCLNRTYDVEIAFNYLVPTFLLNCKSKKLISWIHGSIDDLEKNKWNRLMQGKYLNRVGNIIAISNETEKSILRIYPEYKSKLIKIYNGYDFRNMHSNGNQKENFELLYCNRFDANKNPLFLIEVAKILREDGVDFKIKMLGKGELLERVKAQVKRCKLEKQVEFVGYVNNPYEYFENCKVFCLTSCMEGFPTTLIESMYFGKPFISTAVGGTEELAQDGKCGFVENDPIQYAKKIEILLLNEKVYNTMSNNCSREVKKYSIQRQISEIDKLIWN